CARRDWEFTYW
nr:immunoglobulin heavy chain junction region [Mus musculus]